MSDSLLNAMIGAGVDPEIAGDIVKAHSTEEEEVGTHQLVDALQDLNDLFKGGAAAPMPEEEEIPDEDEEEEDDEDEDDDDDGELIKAFEAALDLAEEERDTMQATGQAIADAADRLRSDNSHRMGMIERQNEVLHKALEVVASTLIEVKDNLAQQNTSVYSSIENLSKALGAPMPPRAVTSETVDFVPVPGELLTSNISKASVVQKALGEIGTLAPSDPRCFDLRKAVTLLDSNANPAEVARKFGLT